MHLLLETIRIFQTEHDYNDQPCQASSLLAYRLLIWVVKPIDVLTAPFDCSVSDLIRLLWLL